MRQSDWEIECPRCDNFKIMIGVKSWACSFVHLLVVCRLHPERRIESWKEPAFFAACKLGQVLSRAAGLMVALIAARISILPSKTVCFTKGREEYALLPKKQDAAMRCAPNCSCEARVVMG